MKRRTLLAGLGTVASGSGAIATSAAIANTVQTASEMNIVVDEQLRVRAGQAFTDDGDVKDEYADQYIPYGSNESFFDEQNDVLDDISKDELPLGDILLCGGFGDPRPEGIRIDRWCSVIRELVT